MLSAFQSGDQAGRACRSTKEFFTKKFLQLTRVKNSGRGSPIHLRSLHTLPLPPAALYLDSCYSCCCQKKNGQIFSRVCILYMKLCKQFDLGCAVFCDFGEVRFDFEQMMAIMRNGKNFCRVLKGGLPPPGLVPKPPKKLRAICWKYAFPSLFMM